MVFLCFHGILLSCICKNIDVEDVDPKNKSVRCGFFLKEIKSVQTFSKNFLDKYAKLFKPNEKVLKLSYCLRAW